MLKTGYDLPMDEGHDSGTDDWHISCTESCKYFDWSCSVESFQSFHIGKGLDANGANEQNRTRTILNKKNWC